MAPLSCVILWFFGMILSVQDTPRQGRKAGHPPPTYSSTDVIGILPTFDRCMPDEVELCLRSLRVVVHTNVRYLKLSAYVLYLGRYPSTPVTKDAKLKNLPFKRYITLGRPGFDVNQKVVT